MYDRLIIGFLRFLGILYSLGLPIYFVFLGQSERISFALLTPGLALLVISYVDAFSEFSLGPISAKLHDKVKAVDEKLASLRRLALKTAKPQVTQLMASNFGFEDGLNLQKRINLCDDIILNLKDLGASDLEVDDVLSDWNAGITSIFYREIGHRFQRRLQKGLVNFKEKERLEIWNEMDSLRDFRKCWQALSSDTIRAFLEQRGHSVLDENVEEALQMYEEFENTQTITNLEVFVNF